MWETICNKDDIRVCCYIEFKYRENICNIHKIAKQDLRTVSQYGNKTA